MRLLYRQTSLKHLRTVWCKLNTASSQRNVQGKQPSEDNSKSIQFSQLWVQPTASVPWACNGRPWLRPRPRSQPHGGCWWINVNHGLFLVSIPIICQKINRNQWLELMKSYELFTGGWALNLRERSWRLWVDLVEDHHLPLLCWAPLLWTPALTHWDSHRWVPRPHLLAWPQLVLVKSVRLTMKIWPHNGGSMLIGESKAIHG